MPDDLYETTVEVSVTHDLLKSLRQAAGTQACLVVISGPKLGQRVALTDASLTVGRGSACALVLDADSVSRQHARIDAADGSHWLVDQNSTNGTYLNDVRVQRNVLRDGDRVGIGKVMLKYLASGNIEAAYHEELERLVSHDGLTGVHNKKHFEEAFALLSQRTRADAHPLSVIVFDLDHFKRVNDTWGHPAGDAILRQVAEVVQREVGTERLLARTGGEEFAIAAATDLTSARALADQVRRAVETSRCMVEARHIPVTVSLGVAERRVGEDEGPEALYARADQALYAAKRAGRNCVR